MGPVSGGEHKCELNVFTPNTLSEPLPPPGNYIVILISQCSHKIIE